MDPIVIDYDWEIPMFSRFDNLQETEVVRSLPFKKNTGTVWRMRLFPSGFRSSSRDFLALFLELDGRKSSKKWVIAHMKFEIIHKNANAPSWPVKPRRPFEFTTRNYWGTETIMPLDMLKKFYVQEDKLRIRCEILECPEQAENVVPAEHGPYQHSHGTYNDFKHVM